MILPVINIGYYNSLVDKSNKNVAFAGIKSVKAKEIKNLHALTCPRCGGPIIEPQKLVEAYRVISLPLKQVLKKGYLDRNQNMTKVWALLNDFAEKYPKASLDKILENEENHTLFRIAIEQQIVPNLDRNNRDLYNANVQVFNNIESGIRKAARTELRSASVVMNRLKSFLPYLKKIEEKEPFKTEIRGKIGAFEELMYYSTVYPDKTLSEIINLPEVRSYIETMCTGTQEEFKHQHRVRLNDMRDIIKRNTKCSEDVLNKLQYKLMSVLFKSNKDPGIRQYNALKLCKEFVEANNCENIYPKLYDIVKSIPEPPYNKYVELSNAFDKKNDYLIVDSLLKPYVGSNEHFIARSTGGEDSRSNKISMHQGCNKKRSNIPYKDYKEVYPRIPYYMGKQIEEVSDYILAGKMISKYVLYPPQIANTIKEATEGAIDIDVTKYCRKMLKKSENKMEKQRQKIIFTEDARDREFARLYHLREEEKVIQKEIETVNAEHKKAIDAHKEERRVSGWLNKYLEDK